MAVGGSFVAAIGTLAQKKESQAGLFCCSH